jgi:hypothetical protein
VPGKRQSPQRLSIEGVTQHPRHEVIAAVSQAILGAGGFIMDSRFFSNLAVFIAFEIESDKLARLWNALTALPVNFSALPDGLVTESASTVAVGTEINGHLSIRFVHQEPDLRISVPAVPG